MGGNGKFLKWKLSFYHRNSSHPRQQPPPPQPPPEYVCPICSTLITDPVVIATGHTFDRVCAELSYTLRYSPTLPDGTRPHYSSLSTSNLIPNLALQSSIPNWCQQNNVPLPAPKTASEVEAIIRGLMKVENGTVYEKENDKAANVTINPSERFLIDAVKERADPDVSHAVTELTHRANRFRSTESSSTSSSEESVIAVASPSTPLPLKTKPACWSEYSSSSEIDAILNRNPNPSIENANLSIEDDLIAKFKSNDPFEQELAAIRLRKLTRNDDCSRISLCTSRMLTNLRSLMVSSYENVQINAIASIVNLSLEKSNKIKIVRSGILPILIDLLKGRSPESQEHAAGAIFSLSIEDDNKTAIGVLGALPPLLHCLMRCDSDRTRSDSALALYHLSLVHSNRVKLVKLGAVPVLLSVLRSSEKEAVSGRVLLVLCQLAASAEGKAAMLDGNAVEHLVAVLRRREGASESTRENCVAALYALSHGSLRFKALAKEARVVEAMKDVVEESGGSERAKEKARRILLLLKGRQFPDGDDDGGEDVDWEAILESGGLSRTRLRIGGGGLGVGGKSSQF